MNLLNIDGLSVYFGDNKKFPVVDNMSYQVKQGEIVGIVGESGSGKSISSLAILNLIDPPGQIVANKIEFNKQNLHNMSNKEYRKLLGNEIAIVFQDPMTSLNPCYTIGFQLLEAIKAHNKISKNICYEYAIDLLNKVGISDPSSRMKMYPHQLSGGMIQRVMIAIAISCHPKLLIADEPTSSLDVTIQIQILELLLDLQKKENMSLILITHDLALVSKTTQNIIVMYAGQIVEMGKAIDIFNLPRHPYTQALIHALPEFSNNKERLVSLPGSMPNRYHNILGCLLNTRCPYAKELCYKKEPKLIIFSGRKCKCHYPLNDFGQPIYAS
ncbi:MAG: ATP-binding cassette domain-containing protein [Pantoea sp. Brub]|nr:ATP-binding cassette domain-containing protein [Pantoea sp. Brub]